MSVALSIVSLPEHREEEQRNLPLEYHSPPAALLEVPCVLEEVHVPNDFPGSIRAPCAGDDDTGEG